MNVDGTLRGWAEDEDPLDLAREIRHVAIVLELLAARAELAGCAFADPGLLDAGHRMNRAAVLLRRTARRVGLGERRATVESRSGDQT
jgi:hypothetical protein